MLKENQSTETWIKTDTGSGAANYAVSSNVLTAVITAGSSVLHAPENEVCVCFQLANESFCVPGTSPSPLECARGTR